MLKALWRQIDRAERRVRRSFGKDIETPGGRFWSKLHYHVFDHAFLRVFWTNFFEVAPGELMELQARVTTMMPAAMDLAVPLLVEAKTGPTWGDMDSVY